MPWDPDSFLYAKIYFLALWMLFLKPIVLMLWVKVLNKFVSKVLWKTSVTNSIWSKVLFVLMPIVWSSRQIADCFLYMAGSSILNIFGGKAVHAWVSHHTGMSPAVPKSKEQEEGHTLVLGQNLGMFTWVFFCAMG